MSKEINSALPIWDTLQNKLSPCVKWHPMRTVIILNTSYGIILLNCYFCNGISPLGPTLPIAIWFNFVLLIELWLIEPNIPDTYMLCQRHHWQTDTHMGRCLIQSISCDQRSHVAGCSWGWNYIILPYNEGQKISLKSTLLVSSFNKHYLNQCWPRAETPHGVTRPKCVNVIYI